VRPEGLGNDMSVKGEFQHSVHVGFEVFPVVVMNISIF
jgi:hypothetical protein